MARVLVMLAVLGVSCMMSGAPCPCGQTFDRDPFGSDDEFFVGSAHDESAHCYCRCGNGPTERLPPSETCEAYEGLCEGRDGEIARFVCE